MGDGFDAVTRPAQRRELWEACNHLDTGLRPNAPAFRPHTLVTEGFGATILGSGAISVEGRESSARAVGDRDADENALPVMGNTFLG